MFSKTTTRLLGLLAALSLIDTVEGACKTDLNDFEMAVLEAHNQYRQQHEDTEPLCYGQSGDDVTFTAQDWTEEQAANKEMQHSSGGGFGENIAAMGTTGTVMAKLPAYVAATGLWYGEIKDWDFDSSASTGGVTGHFTQVVWKGSKQVNCGYATYQKENWNWFLVTCQYYPPGNFNNDYANNVAPIKSTEPNITCTIPDVENGSVFPMPENGLLDEGARTTVLCNNGYKLEGTEYTYVCGTDGQLMPEKINCISESTEPITCPIPDVKNGTLSPMPANNSLDVGAQITVNCNTGFTLEGTENAYSCGTDGELMPEKINCIPESTGPKTCPIPDVENGTLSPMPANNSLDVGAQITVNCNTGFTLEGTENAYSCGADGELMPEKINCIPESTEEETCDRPDINPNFATLGPDTASIKEGEAYTVTCMDGYQHKMYCNADGMLSPRYVTCDTASASVRVVHSLLAFFVLFVALFY